MDCACRRRVHGGVGRDADAWAGTGSRQDLYDENLARDHQRPDPRLCQKFRRRAGEELRRPDQDRSLPGEPIRLDPAANRGRAIRRHSVSAGTAGISGRHRRALRSHGRTGPGQVDGRGPAADGGPGSAEAHARPRRGQGPAWRRSFHGQPVGDRFQGADPSSRRFQRQEDPHLSPRRSRVYRSTGSAPRRWR